MYEDKNSITKEELEENLKAELEWVKYRINMLNIMEKKLYKMREVAQKAAHYISKEETEELSNKIKWLEMQVNALDEESRR